MPIIDQPLTLQDLPTPLPAKTGWPWTEKSQSLPPKMPDGATWPRISIVTPSFNQGQYIEETIRSVLLQGYPNLEYIIIDGDSTDNSVNIIKKYEPYLAYWTSEPDRGQSHAINKGFERCTGDYIAWMNSDDCYMPEALKAVFCSSSQNYFDFAHGPTYGGSSLREKTFDRNQSYSLDLKFLLRFFYSIKYIIPSQSVFVSKSLALKTSFLNESLHYCMDLDWFARISLQHPKVFRYTNPISFFRGHVSSKTHTESQKMRQEAIDIAYKYAHYLSYREQRKLYRLIHLSDSYEKFGFEHDKEGLMSLLAIAKDLPIETLMDRRFLGMLKTKVFYSKI